MLPEDDEPEPPEELELLDELPLEEPGLTDPDEPLEDEPELPEEELDETAPDGEPEDELEPPLEQPASTSKRQPRTTGARRVGRLRDNSSFLEWLEMKVE
ncbi:MAG: hypothetical protein P4L83_21285 [Nevskia sp.]|nr:hypothetical protein [Nevskia sp.]